MEQLENPISEHLTDNDIHKYITINNFEYIFKDKKIIVFRIFATPSPFWKISFP